MKTSRRTFIGGIASVSVAHFAAARDDARPPVAGGRHDPCLAAFISDMHVNGLRKEVPTHCYEENCLRKTVAKILALDPLPAHVVCFGDIAYHWGQPEDYALAASILKPLTDAGIRLTLGMGNHDRRGNFLEVWPEYAKTSPVKGRIVSKVEMPHVDLLMLDTLNADPGRSPEELIKAVSSAVADFAGEAEQYDDQTMLCLVYNGKQQG